MKENPMRSSIDPDAAGARPPSKAAADSVMVAAVAHRPRLVRSRDVGAAVHGASRIGQFNSWLAVHITKAVGTMWAAYLFALISFISLPQAIDAFTNGQTLVGITWLSQSFLQLVLLPVIIVGQNITSAVQDARAEADHETLSALQALNVRQLQLLKHQEKIVEMLSAAEVAPRQASSGRDV
jgi:hypothetical protein